MELISKAALAVQIGNQFVGEVYRYVNLMEIPSVTLPNGYQHLMPHDNNNAKEIGMYYS
jgi:hypothetical protein